MTNPTRITRIGTVIVPVSDQERADADAEVLRMGPYVPPMFTFRDPDGHQLRVVQRD